jgi:hypothetical protein
VELGKQLAGGVLSDLRAGQASREHDSSTRMLIEYILKSRNA